MYLIPTLITRVPLIHCVSRHTSCTCRHLNPEHLALDWCSQSLIRESISNIQAGPRVNIHPCCPPGTSLVDKYCVAGMSLLSNNCAAGTSLLQIYCVAGMSLLCRRFCSPGMTNFCLCLLWIMCLS